MDYKEQVENNLRNEYAQIALKVRRQEEKIKDLETEFSGCRDELEEYKKTGCAVNMLVTYDSYLKHLHNRIVQENKVLKKLQEQAEKKRQEVVAAKVETSSFEKLKEKKRAEYDKEVQRQDEKFIEEFVSNTTSTKNSAMKLAM